jgi:two-component system sensor histidine kinase FlrB
MSTKFITANEQLEDAFELFNQFSEKLSSSYGVLETQVARLTEELAQARSERLIQLTEKEVLASRLEGLLDALPAGIVVLDVDGRITQTNPVARFMLGNNKLLGKKWQDVARQSIKTDADELCLIDGRWINLSVCPLSMNNSGVSNLDTNYTGKIILISDITENRKLQIKLDRQQRLSSLGEMVASLAHQIRTPLSSALLYISTINHPVNTREDRIRFADKTKERLHHLERVVNDMLIFARGDVSNSEYINASETMHQLKTSINQSVFLPNLLLSNQVVDNIQFDIDSNLQNVKIKANSDILQSALQNIIDNAIEACTPSDHLETKMIETKTIKIRAFLNTDKQFEINIADNGCGMPDAIKDKVLEPFFTTRASGTGLGLAVVNATVNRYGGEMKLSSKQGVGSEFTLTFPPAEATGMLPSSLSSKGLNKLEGHSGAKIINIFSGAASGNNTINKQEVAL